MGRRGWTICVDRGEDGRAVMWDAEDGKEVRSFDRPSAGAVGGIGMMSDGKSVVVGDPNYGLIVFDAETGHVERQMGEETRFETELLPQGDASHLLGGGSGGFVRLHDVASGTTLGQFNMQIGGLAGTSLSPDFDQIVVGSELGGIRFKPVSIPVILSGQFKDIKVYGVSGDGRTGAFISVVAYGPQGNISSLIVVNMKTGSFVKEEIIAAWGAGLGRGVSGRKMCCGRRFESGCSY